MAKMTPGEAASTLAKTAGWVLQNPQDAPAVLREAARIAESAPVVKRKRGRPRKTPPIAGAGLLAWGSNLLPVPGTLFEHGEDFHRGYARAFEGLQQECFLVAVLSQKNRLLSTALVSVGSLTECLVHPREVFAPAMEQRAAAVTVLHNHPSGDPSPSVSDKALMERLVAAARLLGIHLLDQIIVGADTYYSFVESGLLEATHAAAQQKEGAAATITNHQAAECGPLPSRWLEVKARYPRHVVGFQIGDFVDFYCHDAKRVAEALGLRLESWHGTPRAGFPVHMLGIETARLLRAGLSVAVGQPAAGAPGVESPRCKVLAPPHKVPELRLVK